MFRAFLAALLFSSSSIVVGATPLKPDLIVAADGSGDFKTIQDAVASIPQTNADRIVVFIKDGTYHEKIRVDASFVTLRGQSRKGTRIEFPQLNDKFTKSPDLIGQAVINLNHANDFVLENLTAENTAGQIGPHAFTVFGNGDRTVIVNCDVLSHGADTVALWNKDNGRYYHANCRFEGSVDFVCPRGWCYATNCTFYEFKGTAAVWHDGSRDKDMKFVLRNCRFDGTNGWNLARHHHDAQFYFIDCRFAATMIDRPPFRVIYPLDGGTPSAANIARNKELDSSNIWGERSYFYNCHRDGGDYAWLTNNLTGAPGALRTEQITAAWTFGGEWNPERNDGPAIRQVKSEGGQIMVNFGENVTVKGRPRLVLRDGQADYVSGSGTDTLVFKVQGKPGAVTSVDLNDGAIIATEAGAALRLAQLKLPADVAEKQDKARRDGSLCVRREWVRICDSAAPSWTAPAERSGDGAFGWRSAFDYSRPFQSGVALRLPPRSKTFGKPALYGAGRRFSHFTSHWPLSGKPGAWRWGAPSQPPAIIATA